MRHFFLSLILAVLTVGTPAMATEEPPFKVAVREGEFEIRDYPTLLAAEVRVGGDRDEASSAGFRLLAGYIFGGNTRQQSIAMTAPVVQEQARGETIAMTAPVTQSGSDGAWLVRFVMPAEYTLKTLPTPNDPRVRLLQIPPQRFAVVRFSGLASPAEVERQTTGLLAFMTRRKLNSAGPSSLARYDPPWTLWFMRRNEVWIPVSPGPAAGAR